MNCLEFEESVRALARNELMDALVYVRGMAHAERCAQCAGRLAAERALLAGIAEVISEVAREQTPARVEAAVLAAFREEVQAASKNVSSGVPEKAATWSPWQLVAAAACILIVGSIMALVWLQGRTSRSNTQASSQPGSTISRAESVPLPGTPHVNPAPEGRDLVSTPPRKTRPAPTKVRPRAVEVVTEFYPIVDGEDLDSLDGGQILRVKLPATALTEAGLAAGPDALDGSVTADVLLGHDGMARAIRFVR